MAWFWGGKTKGLYEYIMLQADDEGVWQTCLYAMRHKPSRVEVWMDGGLIDFLTVDLYDDDNRGKQHVGFSMRQKWKIHRKLKKIKQKFQRMAEAEKRGGFESKVDYYMAEMVGGTLSGEKNKK